jgi:hypothetical protein
MRACSPRARFSRAFVNHFAAHIRPLHDALESHRETAVRVQRVDTRFPDSTETARGPIKRRQSLEYYWSGKRKRGGDKQLCLLRVETDLQSRPWRTSVMYTS